MGKVTTEYHNVRICTVSAYDHMIIGKMKEKGKKKEGKCQNKNVIRPSTINRLIKKKKKK
jgi:hypothetical protein